MARTFPQRDHDILELPVRGAHIRVSTIDGNGLWKELTNLRTPAYISDVEDDQFKGSRRDWLLSASWAWNVEQDVGEAKFTLFRNDYDTSISPLTTRSYWNRTFENEYAALLRFLAPLKVETATVHYGQKPTEGDWRTVWEGTIDEITVSTGDLPSIDVVARDPGGALVDAWITEPEARGDALGVALETQLQGVLDDWAEAPAPTLSTPLSPGWIIGRWEQAEMSVMEALTKLSEQIGWSCRYRWSDVTEQFELTLYEPARDKTEPDVTIEPGMVVDGMKLKLGRRGVRNAIEVAYYDPITEKWAKVYVEDLASQQRYGKLWMRVGEEQGSLIETEAEALALANKILSDLKDPLAEFEVEMPYRPDIELNDLVLFKADLRTFDEDQALAVVSVEHVFDGEDATTSLSLRGVPTAGTRRWLEKGRQTTERRKPRPGETPAPIHNHRWRETDVGGDFFGEWYIDAIRPPGAAVRVEARIVRMASGAEGPYTGEVDDQGRPVRFGSAKEVLVDWTEVPFPWRPPATTSKEDAVKGFTAIVEMRDGNHSRIAPWPLRRESQLVLDTFDVVTTDGIAADGTFTQVHELYLARVHVGDGATVEGADLAVSGGTEPRIHRGASEPTKVVDGSTVPDLDVLWLDTDAVPAVLRYHDGTNWVDL